MLHQVNTIIVQTYFLIGKRIVEQEQKGKTTTQYGANVLEVLSVNLTTEFGKGFSKHNLELIRKFYITYRNAKSPIAQSLSWTHYLHLMPIENKDIKRISNETVEIRKKFMIELADSIVIDYSTKGGGLEKLLNGERISKQFYLIYIFKHIKLYV